METGTTMGEPKKQNADVTLINNSILDLDNYKYYMSQRGVMMVVSDEKEATIHAQNGMVQVHEKWDVDIYWVII